MMLRDVKHQAVCICNGESGTLGLLDGTQGNYNLPNE